MEKRDLGNTISKSPARRWCLTLNNYTDEEYVWICSSVADTSKKIKYIIGKEIGESGTPHLQIYIEWQTRFDTLRKLFPRAHIEKAKGNKKSNLVYCSKDNNYITNWTNQDIINANTSREIRTPIDRDILIDEALNGDKWLTRIMKNINNSINESNDEENEAPRVGDITPPQLSSETLDESNDESND